MKEEKDMVTSMSKKLLNIFMGCIAVLIILCFASSFLNSEKDMLLTYEEISVTKLNSWILESDGVDNPINIEEFSAGDVNFQPYSIATTVSTQGYKKPVIILESMHQAFDITVNSQIVYSFGQDDSSIFSVPNGGIWHFVELPYIQPDNHIEIEVVPSNDKTSIGIIDIYLAEEGEAVLFLIYQNAMKLLVSTIILVIGLILLATHIVMAKGLKNNNLLLYLGLLSTNIAIWLISESNLLQFITGDTFILGHLPYWSIQLLFIPFIFYVDSMYTPSHKSISQYLCMAFIINFILSTVLHMAGIAYYYNTLWIVHFLMLITLLYFIASIVYETFAKKNRDAGVILLQISLLIFTALVEMAVFYLGDNMNSLGVSLQTGMLLYLSACVISVAVKVRAIWAESMHTEYLSKIAYTDILTSLFNRYAFERDLELFKESEDVRKTIVTFDLNNLKYFNDNMGHQTGDNYLVHFAGLAKKYLGEYGNCYRIGGDEFSAILYNAPFDIVEQRLVTIQQKVKNFDKSNKAGVAFGHLQYDKDEYPDIMDYIHHLDEGMFKNKVIIKQDI